MQILRSFLVYEDTYLMYEYCFIYPLKFIYKDSRSRDMHLLCLMLAYAYKVYSYRVLQYAYRTPAAVI